jgi:hypothetical protein
MDLEYIFGVLVALGAIAMVVYAWYRRSMEDDGKVTWDEVTELFMDPEFWESIDELRRFEILCTVDEDN